LSATSAFGIPGDALELGFDDRTLVAQTLVERRPARLVQRIREPLALLLVGRQLVRLRVVHGLDVVLDGAQVPVRRRERGDGAWRQLSIAGKQRQDGQQRARTQLRPASAAHDLKCLHDELDLADTARAELDVLRQILAHHLVSDEALHLTQRVEHTVIEITAVDERRQDVVEDIRGELHARQQARLDVSIAFPIAAVLEQVRFERGEPDRERPARAERTQPHVDAICKSVRRALIEQLDEQLAEALVIALALDLDAALYGSVGIQEHQVDVRREVQLGASELAHAEHEQRQLVTVRTARPPEPRLEARRCAAKRGFDEAFREQRDVGERRFEIRETREIVPRDSRHLDLARTPQRRHRRRFVDFRETEPGRNRLRVERSIVGEARAQGVRVAQQHSEHEVTDDDDAGSGLGCRRRQVDLEVGEARRNMREARFERRWEIDGALQYHRGIEGAGTSSMIPLANALSCSVHLLLRSAKRLHYRGMSFSLSRSGARRGVLARLGLAALACCALAACVTPRVQTTLTGSQEPRLEQDAVVMQDGTRLPLRSWTPVAAPRAAIVAVHGLNDHSGGFGATGAFLAARGFAVYAFDQRGFGLAPQTGIWAGGDRMADDAGQVARVLRLRHPDVPLYALGESMGAAVLLKALQRHPPGWVDAVVLSAPAIWGRSEMRRYQRMPLNAQIGRAH